MANPVLNLLLIDTHSPYSIGIADFSQYPSNYNIVSPTLEISGTSFAPVTITFVPNSINVYTSENLNITCVGAELQPLPDGIYTVKYSIAPAYQNNVTKSFLRVDTLLEKFDSAFLKLDLNQCDGPIRKQRQEELDTINYFIQEAIAAANQCATELSMKMYRKADAMLTNFINNKCSC